MNSTNNPFHWDSQTSTFFNLMTSPPKVEHPIVSRKPVSFLEMNPSQPKASKCENCFLTTTQFLTCPLCFKLSCFPCTQQALIGTDHKCPSCLCPLENVNNRHAEVKVMAQETPGIQQQEKSETCREHKVQLSYYCTVCKTPTCGDCAMFDEKHKNHKFEKLDKIYEEQVTALKKEAESANGILEKLRVHIGTLDSNIEEVTKNKEARNIELTILSEQMARRLGNELKSKLATFIAKKGSINQEIEALKRAQTNLNQQLNSCSKSLLITKSDELLRNLQEVSAKACQADEPENISLDFVSEIAPQYDSAIFSLYPYSVLRQNSEIVYSEPMYCSGLKWRLKVYPNGSGSAKGTYISIFLEMLEGLQSPSTYEYRIELLNQRNPESPPIMRDFVSEFGVGECWGYNKFFKIDCLEEEGYIDPEKDTLIFKFYVRAPTYYQQCQDQKEYIRYMEEMKKQSDALVAQLQEKLALETKEKEKLLELYMKSNKKQESLVAHQAQQSSQINFVMDSEGSTKSRDQNDLNNKLDGLKNNHDILVKTSNVNKAMVQKDVNEEEARGRKRASTTDTQGAHKEGTDICAQFEVLELDECSFQDLSSNSIEEESCVEENIKETDETTPIVSLKNVDQNKNLRNVKRDNCALDEEDQAPYNSAFGKQSEEDSMSNRQGKNSTKDPFENSESESIEVDCAKGTNVATEDSKILSILNDLLSTCEKEREMSRSNEKEKKLVETESYESPLWKQKIYFEGKGQNEKRTNLYHFTNGSFN